jgi:6-phosphogluconolactonase
MKMAPQIVVVPDPEALAQEAARRFTRLAEEAVENRGRFSAALSGGSTPGRLYRRLAEDPHREEMPWRHVHLFWGDERCVPPDHPGSNFRLANEALISHVPIPPDNVHRVRGELEPEAAAQTYAAELHAFFGAPWPRFDLVLLGLGQDGHTASLFPGSDVLDEKVRPVVAVTAQYEDRPAQRVTLTPPAINAAQHVLFLVSGSGKAEVVQAVLEGRERFPAQQIRPTTGQLGWLMDAAAASRLTSP